MRIRQAFASLAVLAVATGTLTACNDDAAAGKADTPALQGSPSASDPAAAGSTSADAGDAGSGGHLDRDGLVQAITAGPLKAGSAHLTMTMSGAMSVTAEGDVSYAKAGPEMRLTMSMAQMGAGKLDMRVVDGIVYMTIPSVTPPGKFLKIDPRDRSNPMSKSFGSLSGQLDPLNSVRAMKSGVRTVTFVGTEAVDGEDADHYRVVVDSAAMFKAMKQKAVPGMPENLTYDMWLDDRGLLRRMQFEVAGQAVDMSMSRWGEPVSVEAPPAGKVVDASSMMQRAG
jgi:LppX_LprAFG lipoprotein